MDSCLPGLSKPILLIFWGMKTYSSSKLREIITKYHFNNSNRKLQTIRSISFSQFWAQLPWVASKIKFTILYLWIPLKLVLSLWIRKLWNAWFKEWAKPYLNSKIWILHLVVVQEATSAEGIPQENSSPKITLFIRLWKKTKNWEISFACFKKLHLRRVVQPNYNQFTPRQIELLKILKTIKLMPIKT